MNILPRTSRFYQNLMAMLLIALITITLSILATVAVPEARPVKHVTPDAVVMRRESLEITPEFEEALNVSMKRGYCQAVNWEWVA